MGVKALGIALKLTFSGMNQLIYPQTWAFTIVVVTCVVTQMNYLNKVTKVFLLGYQYLNISINPVQYFKKIGNVGRDALLIHRCTFFVISIIIVVAVTLPYP